MKALKWNTFKLFLIFCLFISLFIGNAFVFAEGSDIKDLDKSSAFARQAIAELVDKGIITGDNRGNFNPKENVTRAQMAAILVRALNLNTENPPSKPTFKDVPANHWAFPYIEAAYRQGIIYGISKDTFGVNDLCTREQMTTMFVRALGITEKDIDVQYTMQKISKLSDSQRISNWSRNYVGVALAMNLMNGTSNDNFSPEAYASREQAAVTADRFLTTKLSVQATTTTTTSTTKNIKQIAALEASVVLIDTFDKDGVPLSQGSGFAIAKGLFMTNYHVIEGASKFTITDSTGKEYDIQGVVKFDADLDLAIIKSKDLLDIKPLEIGSKATLSKGQSIAAIGSPQGLLNSVSDGIVNGIRDFDYGTNSKLSVIEVTAPVTHGSSGGPLLDMSGKVVGVITAMSSDGSQKFAVAIDHAKGWINELKPKAFTSIAVHDMTYYVDQYWRVLDDDVKDTIYESLQALEDEDVQAYMHTIHKLNPAYKNIKMTYSKLFSIYDYDYTIDNIYVQYKDFGSVKIVVKYAVKKTGQKESTNMNVEGYYELAHDGERWRIFYADEFWSLAEGSQWLTGADLISEPGTTGGIKEPEIKDVELIMKETPLSFNVTDAVMHPTKPVVYITDKANKKVIAYNYITKAIVEQALSLPPESIDMEGNEIYVALLKGSHAYAWELKDQKGAIAILDSETLAVNAQFDINLDPYDIEISRDGYIYVSSGSGFSTQIKSYSRQTFGEVSFGSIGAMSYIELNPEENKIYTNTNSGTGNMTLYNVSNGKFTDRYPSGVNSSYQSDHKLDREFSLSPEGKYLFSNTGNIFTFIPDLEGAIKYSGSLQKAFTDIVFDLGNQRIFTALKGGIIYENHYPNLQGIRIHKVQGEILHLFYRDQKLIALTKANDKYYAEIVELVK